jgi:esterase/lipase
LTNKQILENAASTLLDPLAREQLKGLDWLELSCTGGGPDHYPVVTVGSGPPVLLLHGFDSSNLEFRRLVPLLKTKNTLIIPDLFGFGFCPRPEQTSYGPELVLRHLDALLDTLPTNKAIGVIGASNTNTMIRSQYNRDKKLKKSVSTALHKHTTYFK